MPCGFAAKTRVIKVSTHLLSSSRIKGRLVPFFESYSSWEQQSSTGIERCVGYTHSVNWARTVPRSGPAWCCCVKLFMLKENLKADVFNVDHRLSLTSWTPVSIWTSELSAKTAESPHWHIVSNGYVRSFLHWSMVLAYLEYDIWRRGEKK